MCSSGWVLAVLDMAENLGKKKHKGKSKVTGLTDLGKSGGVDPTIGIGADSLI